MTPQKATTRQLYAYIFKFGSVETAKIAYVIMHRGVPIEIRDCIAQLYELTQLELEQQVRGVLDSEGYRVSRGEDDRGFVIVHPLRPYLSAGGESLGKAVDRLIIFDKEKLSEPSIRSFERFVASNIHPANLKEE